MPPLPAAGAAARIALQQAAHRLSGAGVPARYRDAVLAAIADPASALRDTDGVRIAEAVARGGPAEVARRPPSPPARLAGNEWLVVLAGNVGDGKSFAAGWLVAHRKERSLWLRAREVAEVPSGRSEGPSAFEQAIAAPLLVLDDAGWEHAGATAWGAGRIAAVLAARYEEKRLTLATTNIGSREEFAERYDGERGGRIWDRMREGAAFFVIGGESLRGAR